MDGVTQSNSTTEPLADRSPGLSELRLRQQAVATRVLLAAAEKPNH